jgi:hypothetical protein
MEEGKKEVIDSFNDFFKNNSKKETEKVHEETTLTERFNKERLDWTNIVKQLSSYLKKIDKVGELMAVIYTERQKATEYHHYLVSLAIKFSKSYKTKFAERYDFYTYKSQKRFPNETTKTNQIYVDLKNLVEKRENLDNHIKFMESTIKNIDNIVYGMKTRVDVENILRGK